MTDAGSQQGSTGPFRVGKWLVEPDTGRLASEDEEAKLEPKVMQVLVYLAGQPGNVVSREELENTVWSGTVVGYDAVAGTIIKLRKALGDNSKHPRYIETIPKKGYRLIAEVSHEVSEPAPSMVGVTRKGLSPVVVTSALAVVIVIAVILILLVRSPAPQAPVIVDRVEQTDKGEASNNSIPSVAVLPFTNISREPGQDYFSDGLTDDIITDLSKVAGLRVIARQSTYHYKNTSFTLQDVARDLDVQYIVEGSVRRAGNTLRINVQLTDANKGQLVWGERFDSDVSKVLDIQDKITHRVIDAMYVKLSAAESRTLASRNTNNIDAYDYFLKGQEQISRRSKEGYDLALDAYREAIRIDPVYARAYGAMAVALTYGYRSAWTDLSLSEARERAMILAKKAVSINATSPQVYWSLGFVHLFRKEYNEAEAAAEQAVKLSPNYADGYGLLAFIANHRGNGEAAVRYIKRAIRLNPYYTYDYPWNLGFAYYTLGRYEEAIEQLNMALERNESLLYVRLYLAASLVRLGRMEDAQWEVEQIRLIRSETTLSHLANIIPYEHQQDKDRFLADLRRAGLPE